ncbi:putative Zinc finger, BED-type [Corchorus olitorius]|uniref:Zinc finger, BED-type n=1 Tax=Corchorus olitorius TaxID=93759 RepID=A0A1R3H957_9ROSI|nr:putative Zinc finger, BED-type [Corchorus olitorius]
MENPIQDIPVDIEVDLNCSDCSDEVGGGVELSNDEINAASTQTEPTAEASPSTHAGNQGLSTEPTSVVVENDETRKRAFTSKVWEHVTRFKANDGYPMARCNYCPRTFKAHTKRNETTSMKNHIDSCPKNPAVIAAKEREANQTKLPVMAVTVDNAAANDVAVRHLKNFSNLLVGINEALKDIFEDYVRVMNPAATSSQSSQVQQSSLMEEDDDYDAMAEFQKHQMESFNFFSFLLAGQLSFAAGRMDTGSVDCRLLAAAFFVDVNFWSFANWIGWMEAVKC